MRWTPWIIGKDNGAVGQIDRGNGVAAKLSENDDVVGLERIVLMIMSGPRWLHCHCEWPSFLDIVVFNPDLYCSLKQPGAI